MNRITPPFRADHVGSLLRAPEVLRARDDRQQHRISADDLRRIEDDAIRKVVHMQEDLGLRGITDGEYRRGSWHMDFLYQVGGVTKVQDNLKVQFHNEKGDIEFTPAALRIIGKLKFEKCIFGDDFQFLKSTTTATPKLSIPSPSMMHYRGGRAAIDASVYPDLEEFWRDLGAVYADQIAALGALGCTYLQLDDTSLAYLNDPAQREYIATTWRRRRAAASHLHPLDQFSAREKAARHDGVHAYVPWQFPIVVGRFRQLRFCRRGIVRPARGRWLIHGVRRRALRWLRAAALRSLKARLVVFGLVSTKRGALEKKDDLKRRIEQASKYVPMDQLCLSPQCGFSSTVEGNAITIEEQIAKLQLVVETAREIWG